MKSDILIYLEQHFNEVEPLCFYRSIFPKGELGVKGKKEKGVYNAIAVELLPKKEDNQRENIKRYTITDDLDNLKSLIHSDNFSIISPITYAGKSRESINARFIYAIAIDLDGITTTQQITDLFYQMENNKNPLPTYTVFSGSGLHLYYQFEEPVPCFKNIVVQLSKLKKELTKGIWNRYTTSLYNTPQIESLFQGFRIVGGITKDGKRTKAFKTGDKITIEYLNRFVAEENRVNHYTYKSKLTLAKAQELYPEWYNKRIIENKPKGTWTCKRDLFEWWKRRLEVESKVGHRYYCVMVLSIYAKKCGIPKEELEAYAFSVVKSLDKMTTNENNHFTRADVLSALEMYNDNYITFPIDSIVALTDIPIEKNKRNFRKQETHLKIARFTKQVLIADGVDSATGGRPSKENIVRSWQNRNPSGTKAECIRETGLSKPTVYKHWR